MADNVKQPSHYKGEQGLEVIEVMQNFLPRYQDGYVGGMIKDVIKYVLRAPSKGKMLEDLQKAREYLNYAIEYLEGDGMIISDKFKNYIIEQTDEVVKYAFENGYGASIINHEFSYGLELAVIKQVRGDWYLTYDTPITDDVIGYIESEEELDGYLEQIQALEKEE